MARTWFKRVLVLQATRRHSTAPTASAAFGRTLLACVTLQAFRDDPSEQLQMSFQGNGPIGLVQAIADCSGYVRGRVQNPYAHPPLKTNGKLDVAAAVGQGNLTVVRSHPWDPNPFQSVTPIVSGEIAEDVVQFLAESEQTNGALALGVLVGKNGIEAAGGYYISMLPDASEETIEQLEQTLSSLPTPTQLLAEGLTPHQITEEVLKGIGISQDTKPSSVVPKYGPCDMEHLRGRMEKAVAVLGPQDIRDLVEEKGCIEVTCDFCQTSYQFNSEDALALAAQLEAEEKFASKLEQAVEQ